MSDYELRITLDAASTTETFTEEVSVSIIRDGERVGRMEILASDLSSPEVGGGSG